ncbi:hypothetical protein MyChFU_39710 [Mycobacterium intracellulare subsp. chimaera]
MGLQFRLGAGDHKPVEGFLSREYAGTSAITLDTKAARHQHHAAAAAVDAGLDVYWEPGVERLAAPGFGLEKFPLWTGQPYDTDALSRDSGAGARAALVGLTVENHPSVTTHVTAPHFYVTDDRTAHLNVDLAERTRLLVRERAPDGCRAYAVDHGCRALGSEPSVRVRRRRHHHHRGALFAARR